MKSESTIETDSYCVLEEGNLSPSERRGRGPVIALDSDIFSDIDVKLTAILGRGTIAVRTLLDLGEGSVLDLDTPLDGTIDLLLNDRVIAQGEIVAVDDKFGVRITKTVADSR
jgi:flagellar motor switch protein FliN